MTSKIDNWMPFYIGDYLAATTRLSTEQHGAYLLLLVDYWRNGAPPDDDAVLAQIAKLDARSWKKARPALIGFFEPRGGKLIQKRVERERERAFKIAEERSKAGKAGASSRWQTPKQTDSKPIANAMANGQQTDWQNARQNDAPLPLQGSNEPFASTNVDVSAEPTERPLGKQEVIDAWQTRMVPRGFPAIRKMTAQRERQLRARLKDTTLEEWQAAMDALERSAFCRGENDRGWRADFDFLLQPKSFTKLLEGAYDH